MKNSSEYLKLFHIIFLFMPIVCKGCHSSVHIVNGYKGLVIALSPELRDDPNTLLDQTKQLIRNASKLLHDSSQGNFYFEQATIIVPDHWLEVDTNWNIPAFKYGEADIIVTEKDSIQSFTMQFGGCGKHALPIIMTKHVVLGTGQNQLGNSAKLLVHEWAHYRYGVFNEFGYPSDTLYPIYYSIPGNPDSQHIIVNTCTDGKHSVVMRALNGSGYDCDMTTSNSSGLPTNEDCIPLPDINQNTYESSLLYSNGVNSVTKFCGTDRDHKHNIDSPNKQNVLCDGKDVWSVIKQHPDYKNQRTDYMETEFQIWRDSSPRIVFAVKCSEQMNNFNRILWINIALNKLSKIDLADADTALFTYNNGTAIEVWDWNKAIQQKFYIECRDSDEEINFEAVLTEGTELFSARKGGIFVILIGGTGITASNTEENIAKIAEQLRELNVKLYIIVFPVSDRKHASKLFKTALTITGGKVFHIREDPIPITQTSKSMLNQILKAFRLLQTEFAGSYTKTYQTINELVFNRLKQRIDFEFTTDITLIDREIRVYFVQYKKGVIRSVSIRPPNNDTAVDISDINDPGGYMQGYTVKLNRPELQGQWSITAEVDLDSANPEVDSLIAFAEFSTKSFDSRTITAKCWLNHNAEYTADAFNPLLAYVQINRGYHELVSDLSVQLIVSPERTDDSQRLMLDNGAGDPDITKGDGIYSQYLAHLGIAGYYTISAIIIDRNENISIVKDFGSTSLPIVPNAKACCGSKTDGDIEVLSGRFRRQVECGSIFVTNDWNINDYPPNSVRDLRIESVDHMNREIKLLWTSPGGDYTYNKVDRYEIRAFPGSDNDPELRRIIRQAELWEDEFDKGTYANELTHIFEPASSYGVKENRTITIKSDQGGMYYIALMPYNDKQISSSTVSNIVRVKFKLKLTGLIWWQIVLICSSPLVVIVFLIIILIKRFKTNKRLKTHDMNGNVSVISDGVTEMDGLPKARDRRFSTMTDSDYYVEVPGSTVSREQLEQNTINNNISEIYHELIRIGQQSYNIRLVSYNDKFDELCRIGSGSFGKVVKVADRSDGKIYALKKISIKKLLIALKLFDNSSIDFIEVRIFRELTILSQLNSDYVVQYYSSWIDETKHLLIQMELCSNNLKRILKLKKRLFDRKCEQMMSSIEYYISSELFAELLQCVQFLHEFNPPIIHRDLKPSNILIDYSRSCGRFLKICDFGLATFQNFTTMYHTKGPGTIGHIAPEVLNGMNYNFKADIYSLGIFVLKLFNIDIDGSFSKFESTLIERKLTSLIELTGTMTVAQYKFRPTCVEMLSTVSEWTLNKEEIDELELFDNIPANLLADDVDEFFKIFLEHKRQQMFETKE